MEEQEDQLINQQETEQPEKKRRGRPARIIQSGVTIVDTPEKDEVQEQIVHEESKKKRGRKPKEKQTFDLNDASKSLKQKASMIKKNVNGTKRGRKKIGRNKKRLNVFGIINASIKQFKMPKIKIDLSGIKLPKGLTWGQVGSWTIAITSIVVLAVR